MQKCKEKKKKEGKRKEKKVELVFDKPQYGDRNIMNFIRVL